MTSRIKKPPKLLSKNPLCSFSGHSDLRIIPTPSTFKIRELDASPTFFFRNLDYFYHLRLTYVISDYAYHICGSLDLETLNKKFQETCFSGKSFGTRLATISGQFRLTLDRIFLQFVLISIISKPAISRHSKSKNYLRS